jgi:PhzF family phenazine biosynthesis protein
MNSITTYKTDEGRYALSQIDVFCSPASSNQAISLTGNPVAVVFDAHKLSDSKMQQIARWTNLSETTFVTSVQPDGDYALRIFTPGNELPFAGHPSLGSAFAVAHRLGLKGNSVALSQHCGVGVISVVVDTEIGFAKLKLPTAVSQEVSLDTMASLRNAIACELIGQAKIVNLGPTWLTIGALDGDALLKATPDLALIGALSKKLGITGVNLFGLNGDGTYEVRSFAPHLGVPEDPVCGSGNGAVGYYLRDHAANKPAGSKYTARQGRAIGRDGQISIEYAGSDIWLGGLCASVIEGAMHV